MDTHGTYTKQLQRLLDQLQSGDDSAKEALIEHACERLRRLTRKMKRKYPVLSRHSGTDDVFQDAVMRLYRSLKDVQPDNVRAFMGLASTQIRRQLIDLTRKLTGPEGVAAHHSTNAGPKGPSTDNIPSRYDPGDDTHDPAKLQDWTELHEQIERLPDQEREVTDLIVYQEMSRADIAELLQISERTVKRRWRSARDLLHTSLQEVFPEL